MPTINLPKKVRDSVPTTAKRKYQKIYQDKRWKLIRSAKFRANPVCERCEEKGRVTPTQEIHHVIPFDWGVTEADIESLAFDYDNTVSVCEKCHEELHLELKRP